MLIHCIDLRETLNTQPLVSVNCPLETVGILPMCTKCIRKYAYNFLAHRSFIPLSPTAAAPHRIHFLFPRPVFWNSSCSKTSFLKYLLLQIPSICSIFLVIFLMLCIHFLWMLTKRESSKEVAWFNPILNRAHTATYSLRTPVRWGKK